MEGGGRWKQGRSREIEGEREGRMYNEDTAKGCVMEERHHTHRLTC